MVKGKFVFKPEDRWRNVSDVAKDLISRLLVVEPAKRLTVQQVRDHPWCAEAVKKCAANLPQIKPKSKPAEQGKSSGASVGGFNVPASLEPRDDHLLVAQLRRGGDVLGQHLEAIG